MEKENMQSYRADSFVKKGLVLLGYPEELEICTYIGDDERPFYHVYYMGEMKGQLYKRIKPLRLKDYLDLLQLAMILDGYDVQNIWARVRDEKVIYECHFHVAEFGGMGKKKKRR